MYYAVRKGRTPGIYSTWDEAKLQVEGFKGAVYKKFKVYNDALVFFESDDTLNGGSGSTAKVSYYAVRNDNSIFTSWEECQKHVSGMSGAIFKKFKTEHDANVWLASDFGEKSDDMNESIPTFYVDGSFRDDIISFGMVALIDGKEIHYNGRTDGTMQNCSGEISAFAFALHFANSMNLHEVNVVYDCEHIMRWATGISKASNDEAREFKRFVDKFLLRNQIKINYYKCKAHSGEFYNEKADYLAKRALMSGLMYKQDSLFNEELVLDV